MSPHKKDGHMVRKAMSHTVVFSSKRSEAILTVALEGDGLGLENVEVQTWPYNTITAIEIAIITAAART